MSVEEKVRDFVVSLYGDIDGMIEHDAFYEVLKIYIEKYLIDGNGEIVNGSKIIFDLRGLQANIIDYPQIYRDLLDIGYSGDWNDYNDAKVMHIFITYIRKINNIRNGEYYA